MIPADMYFQAILAKYRITRRDSVAVVVASGTQLLSHRRIIHPQFASRNSSQIPPMQPFTHTPLYGISSIYFLVFVSKDILSKQCRSRIHQKIVHFFQFAQTQR